ncbi:MAG: selenium-binding protein SBP56-related protein [Halieaceae bacterium]
MTLRGFFSALVALTVLVQPTAADETCMSPYMAKIVGQEDYVYIWTLGLEGVGDGEDKLVTVDVNPESASYGTVIHSISMGGRNEAHHSGLTDDRRFLWASGLDTSKIFIFDVHSDPAAPRLHRTIDDFVDKTGGIVGPHTNYALPGRMLITGLSNNRDHGGRTGMARALPRRNVLVSSSFTGWNNYMMNLGKMMGDAEAMKRFGNTVVIWDLHARTPKKILDVPGAPLEIRCAWGSQSNYCFTTTALTSKVWLIYEDEDGEWQAKAVAYIGDASKIPLPVDISISADDRHLWVNTWNDGKVRLFDISDPFAPKQVMEEKIGEQVNMVSQSWDGERVYFTSSLLANWDKTNASEGNDLQYFKLYQWDGASLKPQFNLDFIELGLGAPHQMRFGARALYGGSSAQSPSGLGAPPAY